MTDVDQTQAGRDGGTPPDVGRQPSAETTGRPRYVEVAVVLAALIGVELALFYGRDFGLRRDVAIGGILSVAALKFVLATAWFMHLRTDHAVYRQIFLSGVLLALAVFAAAILIMLFGAPAP